MSVIKVIPIKRRSLGKKKIYEMVLEDFLDFPLKDGDIIAISSKVVSVSEGRVCPFSDRKRDHIIEREAEFIWDSISDLKLSVIYGSLSPNSGIDFSNIKKGFGVLYPTNPNLKAEEFRLSFLLYFGVYVGILIVDSRLFPLRKGTTGIAIGSSGIIPLVDERGKRDLFDNKLKVTKRSIVDDLAAMAHVVMGESDEMVPYVVIRGLHKYVIKRRDDVKMSISPSECIYFRAFLKNPKVYNQTSTTRNIE